MCETSSLCIAGAKHCTRVNRSFRSPSPTNTPPATPHPLALRSIGIEERLRAI
jgi:hypothetical protein